VVSELLTLEVANIDLYSQKPNFLMVNSVAVVLALAKDWFLEVPTCAV
jgi:hypothetical protein